MKRVSYLCLPKEYGESDTE